MFCMNCGKGIATAARFCPFCGARQPAESAAPPTGSDSAAPPASTATLAGRATSQTPGRKTRLRVGVGVLVLAVAGGLGFAAWQYQGTGQAAAPGAPVPEPQPGGITAVQAAPPPVDEAPRRPASGAAVEAVEAREIATARALLDAHIAAEEALARANAQAGPKAPVKPGVDPPTP